MREEDLTRCQYCGKEIGARRWKSFHLGEMHYKSADCGCGRVLRHRVRFLGTGHDSWAKKKIQSILFDRNSIDCVIARDE